MSAIQPAAPSPEFRSYRRFVTWFVLIFVSVGSAYLLVSVGVSIYRRRNAIPAGEKVSAQMTDAEVGGCYDELRDVTEALRKHLENFHHLLAGYDPAEAQRWADEGAVWRGQWKVLGERCRFAEVRRGRLRKEIEEMAAVHDELGATQKTFTEALKRFGNDQAPRLDRIRRQMERIGARIAKVGAPTGETKP